MKVTTCSSLERAKEVAVLFHPVRGQKPWSGGLLNGMSNLIGAIKIIHFERDDRYHVRLPKEALCVRQASERHTRVVLVEARMKDAGHTKPLELGNKS